MSEATPQTEIMKLEIQDDEVVKKDLGFIPVEELEIQTEVEQQADAFMTQLFDDKIPAESKRKAVDEMGLRTQQEVTHLSKMLDAPIKDLAKNGETGGPVAKALLDLKEEVEELDPAHFNLDSAPGFFSSLAKMIPFIGSQLSRYFAKYQSSEEVINQIIDSLEKGKEQLKRDNIILSQDQLRMKKAMEKLQKTIQLGRAIDMRIQHKLDVEIPIDNEQHGFIQEEIMFPLRQRIIDLQQTLAVNQQGILTTEIIIRNNRELVRGVNRALNVTISALQIAVASALALNNQEIVLKKINAINETTSNLIAHNAERLKTQGAAIHKQASESMLDMDKLEKAFDDIRIAIEDISKFRQEALPKMANNILRMDQMNKEAVKQIDKMAKGNEAQKNLFIDVEDEDFKID